MKKIFVSAVALLLQSINVCAEDTNFTTIMGNDFGIAGGSEGKTYMAIFKSDMKKKDLVQKTINMLSSMNLVDKSKVNLKNIGDGATEYVTSFVMNTGVGIHPAGSEPLHLHGNLRFEFYEGGMKLKMENLSEEFFVVHGRLDVDGKGSATLKKYQEYVSDSRKVASATSSYGKFIAKIDKLQEIKHISNRNRSLSDDAKSQVTSKINEANAERIQLLEDYRARVIEQEAHFKKMVQANEAQWYTLSQYIDAAKNSPTFMKYKNAANHFLQIYEVALKSNKLYALKDKRWKRDIRYVFDGLFITLAEVIDGTIEGIAEDGIQTWEREGDLVVPTNPKEKSKYMKKGKSFTDYESRDN